MDYSPDLAQGRTRAACLKAGGCSCTVVACMPEEAEATVLRSAQCGLPVGFPRILIGPALGLLRFSAPPLGFPKHS